ncbi:HMG box-containing protein [Phaffia rhodozyma]|uniref:HMG box-containing protein n=1 Tax=Phaffia rhodozyma TaxID=264483 RepID=A0A0F7SM02_PHARH|nr:HMG box-containing protein [Phaffia rhodozyma]
MAKMSKARAAANEAELELKRQQAILGTLKHASEPELSAAENKKRKRKEAKAAKDPNVPKKPSTAYLTYQNEMKTQVVEDNKDKGLKYTDILRIIADKWKNLPEEAKKEYTDKQHDDMETYKANLANYNRAKKAAEGGFPLDDATMEVPEDQVDEDDEEIDEIDQAQEKSDSETDEESVESG